MRNENDPGLTRYIPIFIEGFGGITGDDPGTIDGLGEVIAPRGKGVI